MMLPFAGVHFCIDFHQIFMFFRTPSQRPFLEGPSARLASKVRFWCDFWFSRGPQIRRHRPVSGVSDKRSQHQRSATFGGLPSLPPGVHRGNQNGIQNRTSALHCRHQILASFWHAFFPAFLAFWWPFGSPLDPFEHFGCILGSISAPFWLTFTCFFQPCFWIDFLWIFGRFLVPLLM